MIARKPRIIRAQLKRAVDAIKSLCEEHEHRLLSLPIPLQKNISIPLVLLTYYLQETESDIRENARHSIAFEVLFNELVKSRLEGLMKTSTSRPDASRIDILHGSVRSYMGSITPRHDWRWRWWVYTEEHYVPLLSARMEYVWSSLVPIEGGTGLTSANFKNIYPGANVIDDLQLQRAYSSIVGTALRYSFVDGAYKDLRNFRLILQSANGVKYLTPKGNREAESLIADVERWHNFSRTDYSSASEEQSDFLTATVSPEELLSRLQSMPPDVFERLCQQLLLKSGVEDIRVTGRTGDEGIDGQGIIRLEGLTNIPVVFQAKCYSGSVGVSAIRDFRGAMDGRASTGFLITTGSFTNQALLEAERAGAMKIDLIDGDALVGLLKKHDIDSEQI